MALYFSAQSLYKERCWPQCRNLLSPLSPMLRIMTWSNYMYIIVDSQNGRHRVDSVSPLHERRKRCRMPCWYVSACRPHWMWLTHSLNLHPTPLFFLLFFFPFFFFFFFFFFFLTLSFLLLLLFFFFFFFSLSFPFSLICLNTLWLHHTKFMLWRFDYASVHLVMSTVCFFFMRARINNIYFGWWWCVQHLTSWWWRLSIQLTRIRRIASNVTCRNSVITVWSSADMPHHGINRLYTHVTCIRFIGDMSKKQWRVLVDAVQIVCDIPLEYPFHCWVVWLVVCLSSV